MISAVARAFAVKMSWLKRIGAFLVCCVFVFSMISAPRARAVAPALALPVLAEFLLNLCVTAGVTFVGVGAIDTVVDFVWDSLDESTRLSLSNSYREGTLVLDAATGAYKWVCRVGDEAWAAIKSAVDLLLETGDNDLTEGGYSSFDASGGVLYSLDGGFSALPLTFSYSVSALYVYYLSGTSLVFERYSSGSLSETISYPDVTEVYYELFDEGEWVSLGIAYGAHGLSTRAIKLSLVSNVSYGSVPLGTVYGDPTMVDNPAYEWPGNERTKEKDIGVLLPAPAVPGSIAKNPDGVPVPRDWAEAKAGALGKTAEDISAQDLTGVRVMEGELDLSIDAAVTDYVGEIEEGSEENTSLKALFFSKFPFCLPWDLKNGISLLLSDPQPPEWEIDLVPPSIKSRFGIVADTTWCIGMDGLEVVGEVSRWTSTIGFCIVLIVLTRKIINS